MPDRDYYAETRVRHLDRRATGDEGYAVTTVPDAGEAHPEGTLFAVFWGRPRHDVLDDTERLARRTAEEESEARAAADAGRYDRPAMLQDRTGARACLPDLGPFLSDGVVHGASGCGLGRRVVFDRAAVAVVGGPAGRPVA